MPSIKQLRYLTSFLFIVLCFSSAAKAEQFLTIDDGKAHYIIEVMRHTTWPNEDQITHFNIVILGRDKNLLNALKKKDNILIRGKSITIKAVERLNNIQKNSDVIIIPRGNLSLISDINENYRNTLIISDGAIDKKGLMVGLLTTRKNIKVTVNRENLIKYGFTISNELLDFAGTKSDLKDQLKDRESALNRLLSDVKVKEEQLKKLNESLTTNKENLQIIQVDLTNQKDLLTQAQQQLINAKNQFNSLTISKKAIKSELSLQKTSLLAQQKLMTEKETEHALEQQKLLQLKLDIEENEKKLQQQIKKLKQQSSIIEDKEQKISGQQQLLYITITAAIIILFLTFIVLTISKSRKNANKELAKLNEQLYLLATKDDMTKLFNRRHFLELAHRELSQLQRTKSMGVALMIDIDHFKSVNDNHGHGAGDQAIINVAKILIDNLREYDIVGRVGGEEFAMFLPNSEIDVAMQIAERIRIKVANLSTLYQQTSIKLTVSIGLTAKKENENSINDMLQRADSALYQAKNSGRNKVALL